MTLRITAEIVPFGDEGAKREIAVIEIYNRGHTGEQLTGTWCEYDVKLPDGEIVKLGGHRREDGWLPLAERAIQLARQKAKI